jgi:hypothetical protein
MIVHRTTLGPAALKMSFEDVMSMRRRPARPGSRALCRAGQYLHIHSRLSVQG